MAAPSGNGVFVAQQYIPAVSSSLVHQGSRKCQTQFYLKKFIKGEPKALGVVQIMIGLVNICVGGILSSSDFTDLIRTAAPYWSAVVYFISGGLTISAQKKGTRSLVIGSLVMNIFSFIAAGLSIMCCSWDFQMFYQYENCYFDDSYECRSYKHAFTAYQHGIEVVFLLLALLELCVSVVVFAFGCASVCNCSCPSRAQHLFVVQNAGTQDPRVVPIQAQGVPLAQGVAIGHGMPLLQGMPMQYGLSTAPAAQVLTSATTSAPPQSYYEDVLDDAYQY